MSKKYRLYQIDSFTKKRFTGNPAGVITNADGLSENQMQEIARELNNSETAFIFTSNSDDYDIYIRYFTPSSEVPICGHATIAAHYARAMELNLETMRINQKSGVGILPVDIIKSENDYKVVMTQGDISFGDVIDGENRDILISALGIREDDLLPNAPIQIVSTGHSKVMIPIKSKSLLNNLEPNYFDLAKLSDVIMCNGFYVFTQDSDDDNILVHGRMFAPAIGINEDPVTGNANGPLGAYLIQYNLVQYNDSLFKFRAKQGEAMGRSGTIDVEVSISDDKPVQVKISGEAVSVFKSELVL